MDKKDSLKKVYVKWVDPTSRDDWHEVAELDHKINRIHSVGFLLHEDAEVITLCLNIDQDNGDISQTLSIPRSIIESIKELHESKTKPSKLSKRSTKKSKNLSSGPR